MFRAINQNIAFKNCAFRSMEMISYAKVVDNDSKIIVKDKNLVELTSLEEVDDLLTTSKPSKSCSYELVDGFGDELCSHIHKMTEHWRQFCFFDMKDPRKIVADMSRISLGCVTQVAVPTESDDEDLLEETWGVDDDTYL